MNLQLHIFDKFNDNLRFSNGNIRKEPDTSDGFSKFGAKEIRSGEWVYWELKNSTLFLSEYSVEGLVEENFLWIELGESAVSLYIHVEQLSVFLVNVEIFLCLGSGTLLQLHLSSSGKMSSLLSPFTHHMDNSPLSLEDFSRFGKLVSSRIRSFANIRISSAQWIIEKDSYPSIVFGLVGGGVLICGWLANQSVQELVVRDVSGVQAIWSGITGALESADTIYVSGVDVVEARGPNRLAATVSAVGILRLWTLAGRVKTQVDLRPLLADLSLTPLGQGQTSELSVQGEGAKDVGRWCCEDACLDSMAIVDDAFLVALALDARYAQRRRWTCHLLGGRLGSSSGELYRVATLQPPRQVMREDSVAILLDVRLSKNKARMCTYALWRVDHSDEVICKYSMPTNALQPHSWPSEAKLAPIQGQSLGQGTRFWRPVDVQAVVFESVAKGRMSLTSRLLYRADYGQSLNFPDDIDLEAIKALWIRRICCGGSIPQDIIVDALMQDIPSKLRGFARNYRLHEGAVTEEISNTEALSAIVLEVCDCWSEAIAAVVLGTASVADVVPEGAVSPEMLSRARELLGSSLIGHSSGRTKGVCLHLVFEELSRICHRRWNGFHLRQQLTTGLGCASTARSCGSIVIATCRDSEKASGEEDSLLDSVTAGDDRVFTVQRCGISVAVETEVPLPSCTDSPATNAGAKRLWYELLSRVQTNLERDRCDVWKNTQDSLDVNLETLWDTNMSVTGNLADAVLDELRNHYEYLASSSLEDIIENLLPSILECYTSKFSSLVLIRHMAPEEWLFQSINEHLLLNFFDDNSLSSSSSGLEFGDVGGTGVNSLILGDLSWAALRYIHNYTKIVCIMVLGCIIVAKQGVLQAAIGVDGDCFGRVLRDRILKKACWQLLYTSLLLWTSRLSSTSSVALSQLIDLQVDPPLGHHHATTAVLERVFPRRPAQGRNLMSAKLVSSARHNGERLWTSLWQTALPSVSGFMRGRTSDRNDSLRSRKNIFAGVCAFLSPSSMGQISRTLLRLHQNGVVGRVSSFIEFKLKAFPTNYSALTNIFMGAVSTRLESAPAVNAQVVAHRSTEMYSHRFLELSDVLIKKSAESLSCLARIQHGLTWLLEVSSASSLSEEVNERSSISETFGFIIEQCELLLGASPWSLEYMQNSSFSTLLQMPEEFQLEASSSPCDTKRIVDSWTFQSISQISTIALQSDRSELEAAVVCVGEALQHVANMPVFEILCRKFRMKMQPQQRGDPSSSPQQNEIIDWFLLCSIIAEMPELVVALIGIVYYKRCMELFMCVERVSSCSRALTTASVTADCITIKAAYRIPPYILAVLNDLYPDNSKRGIVDNFSKLFRRALLVELEAGWLSVYAISSKNNLLDETLIAIRHIASIQDEFSTNSCSVDQVTKISSATWTELVRLLISRACEAGRLDWLLGIEDKLLMPLDPTFSAPFNYQRAGGKNILESFLKEFEVIAQTCDVLHLIETSADHRGGNSDHNAAKVKPINYFECLALFYMRRGDYREAARVSYLFLQRQENLTETVSLSNSAYENRSALITNCRMRTITSICSCLSLLLPKDQTYLVYRPILFRRFSMVEPDEKEPSLCLKTLTQLEFEFSLIVPHYLASRTKNVYELSDSTEHHRSLYSESVYLQIKSLLEFGLKLHTQGLGGVNHIFLALAACRLWVACMDEGLEFDGFIGSYGSSSNTTSDSSALTDSATGTLLASISSMVGACTYDDHRDIPGVIRRCWWRWSADNLSFDRNPGSFMFSAHSPGWTLLEGVHSKLCEDRDTGLAWGLNLQLQKAILDGIISSTHSSPIPERWLVNGIDSSGPSFKISFSDWMVVDELRSSGRLNEACQIVVRMLESNLGENLNEIFISYRHLDLLVLCCEKCLQFSSGIDSKDDLVKTELKQYYDRLLTALELYFENLYIREWT